MVLSSSPNFFPGGRLFRPIRPGKSCWRHLIPVTSVPDPNPDSLVRGMDPDPDPALDPALDPSLDPDPDPDPDPSIIMEK